jgi:pimeloyl-ACP methyl ester carboxylesterase
MLFYETYGDQEKLIIFLHGNSQSNKIWNSLIELRFLQAHYKLINVDLPGHGRSFRSSRPFVDYRLKGMVELLANFISNYQANEFVIVCHSLSTNLVAEIADRFVGCKGCFLIGADILGEGFSQQEIFKENMNLAANYLADPDDAMLSNFIADQVYKISPGQMEELKFMFKDTDSLVRPTLAESIAAREWTDEILKLKASALPLAFVYGKEEKLCNPDYLNRSSIQKWRKQIITIPNSGHCVHFEKPDIIARLILEFSTECFEYSKKVRQ